MKLAETASKSSFLVLVIVFVVWFLPEFSSVPATGNLFEKLLLTTPVVLALRISVVFIALGIVCFLVALFWKQIAILKIGSAGIEFGRFAETSSKADAELAAKDAIIRNLEAEVQALRRSLKDLSEVVIPTQEDEKDE